MTANRLGLSVLVLTLTTTVSLAQNTSNPLLSGNTVNPVMSGNTVAAGREAPVYGPALLRATDNRRHHDVNWSGISERFWTSG
jgi:hypothetical protein